MVTRRKKMPNSQNSNVSETILRNYTPAYLHKNVGGWLIEYYVFNPATKQLERKRIRLNMLRKRSRTLQEFRVAANDIVCTINSKLAGGWTPFGESENVRYYTPIPQVMDLYLNECKREKKDATVRSYLSFSRCFLKWIEQHVPNCKCILFNKVLAVTFMDDFYQTHTNARTYNNMLKMSRAFFNWCKQHCYIKENPFEMMPKKREGEKKRTIIPIDVREKISQYYSEYCPPMVIVCHLVYSSLIRPAEITRIKVGMIHLSERYIAMPESITKNGFSRNAPLTDKLCDLLRDYVAFAKPEHYLFTENWCPGSKPINDKRFTKQWIVMRKRLSIPDEMQLYSLRDTGIFDKIKSGIDPLTVMQAADHHDLQMTTRYANHVDPNMVRIIAEQSPDF